MTEEPQGGQPEPDEDDAPPMNPQGIEDHPDTNADPDAPKTAAEALEQEGEPEHPDADPAQPDNQQVEKDEDSE